MDIFGNIITIISAVIAGRVLLKASTLEYVQRKQRAHWFFDEYLLEVGKCIADYEKNKDNYFSAYMRYLLYEDLDIAEQMEKINMTIKEQNEEKIIDEVIMLKQLYSNKYDMNQFYIRAKKRHFFIKDRS